jgi:WD40 repeat protein
MYARVTEKLFGAADPVKIGRYRVEGRLGQGAMGVVYAAVDEQLGRRVALKLLHPVSAGDATGRARLLREAQAMARLRHENVALVYDVGTHEPGTEREQVFIALELVEGVTLDVWLRQAPRAWPEVLALFQQAGRALAAAHRAGVLHRDFKPENVLVDAGGRARVLDFGLARALAEPAVDDPADSLSTPLTRTGSILGTPAYMAPEQLRGDKADARADQFSFCVALYEGLYGERPFAGVHRFEGVRVTHAPKDGRVPGELRRVLLRGLADAPDDRHVDMDALLAALRPPPRRRWRPLLLGAGGLALLGLGAWGAVVLRAHLHDLDAELSAARAHAREQAAAASDKDSQLASEREAQARRAAEERRVAHLRRLLDEDPTAAALLLRELGEPADLDLRELRRRALAQPLSRGVLALAGVRAVGFTAAGDLWAATDGEVRRFTLAGAPLPADEPAERAIALRLAAGRDAPVKLPRDAVAAWPAPGGGPGLRLDRAGRLFLHRARLREHEGPVAAVAWSPSGERVAVAGGAAIRVFDRRGALRHVLPGHDGGVTALAFGPRGDQLLTGAGDRHARVFRLSSATPAATVLRGHAAAIDAVAWHPDGDLVATAAADGVRAWTLAPAVRARFDHPPAVQALAWSPDGARLASAGDDGRIRLFAPPPAGESAPPPVPAPPLIFGQGRSTLSLAWSPDGGRLASAGGDTVVRVWSPRGELLHALPTGARRGEDTLAVAWGPGGGLLGAGNDERARWWAGGAGEPAPVPGPRGALLRVVFSPDGAELATATVGGDAHRWAVDTSGGAPALRDPALLGRDVNDLAWCGPGWLALAVDDGRAVVQGPAGASASRQLSSAAKSVACDPAGTVIAVGLDDGRVRLWPRSGGKEVDLEGHAAAVDVVTFSADGARLASADASGRIYLWPQSDAEWTAALTTATSACLTSRQREELLAEPADVAAAAAAACELSRGRVAAP